MAYLTSFSLARDLQKQVRAKKTNEAMTCPSWLRDFQRTYLQNGIKNTTVQEPYMVRLAEQYEEKYKTTRDWSDALKVRCAGI